MTPRREPLLSYCEHSVSVEQTQSAHLYDTQYRVVRHSPAGRGLYKVLSSDQMKCIATEITLQDR